MAKGELYAFAAMIATAGAGIAWIEFMLRAMRPVEPEQAHGDVPHLPEGVKAAAKSRCEAGERHQAAQRPSGTHTQQFTRPSHWTGAV